MKYITRVSVRAPWFVRGPHHRTNGRYSLWFAHDDPLRLWFEYAMELGLETDGGWMERA